jgi:hypothetical protein
MKIIHAILAENCDDFMMMVQQAESFTDYVQINMMDGTSEVNSFSKEFNPA